LAGGGGGRAPPPPFSLFRGAGEGFLEGALGRVCIFASAGPRGGELSGKHGGGFGPLGLCLGLDKKNAIRP